MQKFRLPLWALVWIALVLLALVIFLANQGAVDRLLAATGLEKILYPQGKNATPVLVQAPPLPPSTVLVEPAPAAEAPLEVMSDPTPTPQNATEGQGEPEPPLPATPNTFLAGPAGMAPAHG